MVPLKGKAPFLPAWQNLATLDEATLERWDREYPGSNVGCVASDDTWMLDVDDMDWFMENAPQEPAKTLTVKTGSGKLHFYFKHDAKSKSLPMRAVMNPRYVSKAEATEARPHTPNEPQKFIEFPDQVVGPGSVHPVTDKEYLVMQEFAVNPAPASWVQWLHALAVSRPSARAMKVNPLKAGLDPGVLLAEAGLKFEESERDGKVYYNYHAAHGKCLVRGLSHAEKGETPNPRQSAFVWNKENGEFWHQCFSGGCQVPGKTNLALAELGLRLEDFVQPKWRECFETYEDFANAPELDWAIKGLVQEESMTMLAGLSGHGKSWVMMCAAFALAAGGKLFDNFECKQSPNGVLYLVPEVGRRAFWNRAKKLGIDQLVKDERILVRTLSMGPVIDLLDKRMLSAAKGRDVFLDTAVRFMSGEENKAEDNNLAESGFALLNAGARTWWGAHHAPKSFEKERSMTLEGMLRGTGDIGAMLSTCYGVRQLDKDSTLLHIECVKGRDLDELPRPFQVMGRPHVDKIGKFLMTKPQSECKSLREELDLIEGKQGGQSMGRPVEKDYEEIRADRANGMSVRDIAKKHKMSESGVSKIFKKLADQGKAVDEVMGEELF